MLDDGSLAFFIFGSEVKGLRDSGFLVAHIAPEKLFLIGGLVIDELLGVDQLVPIEHLDFSNGEGALPGVDFLDEGRLVDEGGVDIGP